MSRCQQKKKKKKKKKKKSKGEELPNQVTSQGIIKSVRMNLSDLSPILTI